MEEFLYFLARENSVNTRSFYKQHLYKKRQAETDKNREGAKQHLMNFSHILHSCYHPKIIGQILQNKQKNKCFCFHQIIWIIMKMKMEMKKIWHKYDINRSRSGHEHSLSECLSMMMLIY